MAIPMLKPEHLIQFGGTAPVEGKPIAVYGAGTGLGVAHRVHVDKRWVSLPGEGGRVDFAPNSEEEGIILEELRAEIGHVSAERVLSGPGLVNLYRAIVKSDGRLPENLQPKDVTERALADSCIDCRRALSLFCVIMGRFGGNLALNLGTFGGVYIAGGSCRASSISLPPPASVAASKTKAASGAMSGHSCLPDCPRQPRLTRDPARICVRFLVRSSDAHFPLLRERERATGA